MSRRIIARSSSNMDSASELAVADLGDTLQVAGALLTVGLALQLVDALRDLLDAIECALLALPARGERVTALAHLRELALERLAAHGAGRELDLELAHAPF